MTSQAGKSARVGPTEMGRRGKVEAEEREREKKKRDRKSRRNKTMVGRKETRKDGGMWKGLALAIV